MSFREFDDFELDVISRMASGGSTDAQIANVLQCADKDVVKARRGLAIRSLNARDRVPWTMAEEVYLRELVEARWSNAKIAEKLGRKQDSVWGKRRVLGLTKSFERQTKAEGELVRFASVRAALRYPPMKMGERDPYELDAQLRAFALAMREAGHKHGTGELHIEQDAHVGLRFSTPLTHSPIGSSAAACVG